MASTVIDYAAGVPSAASIKAAGHVGAVRYISPPRPGAGWMVGKPMHRREVEDLRAQGLAVAVVWQFGKDSATSPPDVMRGAMGGELDARSADEHLKAIGLAGWPVFFAVDFDITPAQWNDTAVKYFEAAVKVLGRDRVGIYGHSRVCDWAREDRVIADLGGGKHLMWQTRSWSAGVVHSGAVLYQRIVDTASTPGPRVSGVVVDVNDVLHSYWGQRAPGDVEEVGPVAPITKSPGRRGDPVWLPEVLRAFGVTVVEDPGWKLWGAGDFGTIWGVVGHHTGANNTSTDFIRYNPMLRNNQGQAQLSSQIHLSRAGVVTLVGAGIAWHAGRGSYPGIQKDNANAVTIGIEAQSDGTSPWPAVELDAYYRTVAAILWYLDLPASRVIAHHEWSSEGKWDPGAGNGSFGARMDMNEFRRKVQHYIDNPPFGPGAEEVEAVEVAEKNGMVPSFVNPSKEFTMPVSQALIDRSTWETRVLLGTLLDALGLDAEQIVADAIAEDIAATKASEEGK